MHPLVEPRLAPLVGVIALTAGCAIGAQRAAAGAGREVVRQTQEVEGSEAGPVAERSARGLTKGVLAQLTAPEQVEQLRATSGDVSSSVVRGATGSLAMELGDDGQGPFAQSLAATFERLSASAVRGARGEMGALLPECAGQGREECLERRATDLSRAVATGFRQGLRGVVALPALALAFIAGLLVPIVVLWVRSARDSERKER